MSSMRNPAIVAASCILAVSFIVMLLAYGVRHSFSVFFPFILEDYSWSRGGTAFMFSLHLMVYGICAPIAGSLTTNWPAKPLLIFGICVLGVAAGACAFATELWHFYLLFGVLAPIGLACAGSPVLNPTIMNWFHDRRGMALGLAQTGGGLSFVFVFMMESIIVSAGWRSAYLFMGALTIVILLPIIIFGYTFSPEHRNLKAIGSSDNKLSNAPGKFKNNDSPAQWTPATGIRNPRIWLLFVSNMLFWGTGCYLILAHQVKFAIDLDFSSTAAAATTGIFGICMVLGQASSFISDYIGREKTVLIATGLTTTGTLILLSLNPGASLISLYSFAALFGFGAGIFAVCVFVGTADIFSGRYFGLFGGIVTAGMGFGGAFGPWLGGLLFDVSGSYQYSFIFSASSFLLAFICFYLAAPRRSVTPRWSRI